MKERPLVSIIFPTRGRSAILRDNINRLKETIGQQTEIEICIKVDEDDIETKELTNSILDHNFKVITTPRLHGYFSLPEFFQDLYRISTGTFVMHWNDDVYLEDAGNLVESMKSNIDNPCIIASCQSCNFPLAHRLLFEWMIEKYGENFQGDILYFDGYLLGFRHYYPELISEYSSYRYSHIYFNRNNRVEEMLTKLGDGDGQRGYLKGYEDTNKTKEWLRETEHIRGMHAGHRIMEDWGFFKAKREEYLKL